MEVKERILIKASEMFLSMGVKNVTMDALASELGISKRTIYELFNDKDDLVIQSLQHMILEDNKEILRIIEGADNVVEAIMMILKRQELRSKEFPKVFMEDIKKYFHAVNATFYSCKETLKEFSSSYILLDKGVKQGIFRKDLRIELVDAFIHEIISFLHKSERIHLMNPTPHDIFKNILFPYFMGISTPKGINLINQYLETHTENLSHYEH